MSNTNDDLDNEYDLGSLGKGVRGKYYERYQKGTNVIVTEVIYAKNGNLVEVRPGSADEKSE